MKTYWVKTAGILFLAFVFTLALSGSASNVSKPTFLPVQKTLALLERECRNLRSADAMLIAHAITEAEDYYDVPAELIVSIMLRESQCRSRAVSRKGAQGLMQVMPSTAKQLGRDAGAGMRENILAGAQYYGMMLKMFNGDERLALAAYNAGPAKVHRYRGVPPYKETRKYVDAVLKTYHRVQSTSERA